MLTFVKSVFFLKFLCIGIVLFKKKIRQKWLKNRLIKYDIDYKTQNQYYHLEKKSFRKKYHSKKLSFGVMYPQIAKCKKPDLNMPIICKYQL